MKDKVLRYLFAVAVLCCSLSAQAFDYSYKGVNFSCKAVGSTVVIKGFDRKAPEVVIPAQVSYRGITYQVKEVSTFVNGDNYSARTLVLEEGIERIGNSSFIEFRKLVQVSLPTTISEIGRNAFRNNDGLVFSMPQNIDEASLRRGQSMRVTPGSEVAGHAQPLLAQDNSKQLREQQKQQAAEQKRLQAEQKRQAEAEQKRQAAEQKRLLAEQKRQGAQKNNESAIVPEPQPEVVFVSDIDRDIPVAKTKNENTYCVIIANEHYDEAPDVAYAINDGTSFRQYCEKTLGIPAKNVKFFSDATGGVIRRAIGWLEGIQKIDPNPRLIFYYAGHGMPNDKDRTPYIIPRDGWTKDMATTCVSMKEIYQKLGRIRAESVTVLMDACFSGMRRGQDLAILPARSMAMAAKAETLSGNVITFSAASGDETAMDYKEQQHGLFTYYLLSKLKETRGNVSLGELFESVSANVKKESFLSNDKMQTPIQDASPAMKPKWKNLHF